MLYVDNLGGGVPLAEPDLDLLVAFANLVGTAKETVIRLLSQFKTDGTVSTQGRKITIENEAELVRISNMYD